MVFAELASRELPGLRWGDLVRTLQLLELAGEAVAGRFFEGVRGLQFASPAAVERLRHGLEDDRLFWMNACDPASACGLSVDGLDLPRRVETTHLVFRGRRLEAVSLRTGRELDLRMDPTDPELPRCLRCLEVQLERDEAPRKALVVETINGVAAPESLYRPVLERLFHVSADPRTLRLSRRY